MKITIENLPMIFSWDEWPSGQNIAHSPAVWDEMFEAIPSESFGLNVDPSHLVWLQIDYERVVYDYASRIIHVHGRGSRDPPRRPTSTAGNATCSST